jgi:tetratricopeptide (TPR) repeat protein
VPAALLAPLVGTEAALETALAQLAEAEMLYRVGGRADAYAFKHALTQDVAYRSLLIAHRQPLRARLLELAEAHWAERRAEHVERLADHARHGAIWDRAATYLTEAGERAVQHSNFARARVHFERAIEALRQVPASIAIKRRMAELHLRMRAVLNMSSAYSEVPAHIEAAAVLADETGDDVLRCHVQIHLNYFYNTIGDFDRCHEPARLAVDLAQRTGDPILVSEAALARGQLLRLMGDYPGAIRAIEPALPIWLGDLRLHRGGHLGTRSIWALGHLALACANMGRADDARAHADLALRFAEETARPSDLQFALHHVAIFTGCGAGWMTPSPPTGARSTSW